MDIPRIFVIRERSHRILNPLLADQLATLGQILDLTPGTRILDLACGKGELLCTWARDHGVTGTGVDLSTDFLASARTRATELGVADRVDFVHSDAGGYVSPDPVDVAACVGASWIADGTQGTMELLERSLRPGGTVLVGEVYWRQRPPAHLVSACEAQSVEDFRPLPDLVGLFHQCGWDLVQLMLADQQGWDRYVGAGWMSMRRWLDENPDDPFAPEVREHLTQSQVNHPHQREYLGWGIFALRRR